MARDADFCRGTPAYCDNRANGSRANIGYRIGISEYEARVDCQARLGGTANCGNTNPDLQHYLYGGQPAVVITNVEVNGQRELGLPNNRNQICGYWHRTTGNGTSPTVQGDGFAPLPTVFGPAESSNYGTYLGSAPLGLTAPTALVDFNAVTGGAYALLNCNYAPVGSSDIAALVIDGIPDIDYTTSFTGQGPHGPVTETANGCFVEIDDVRSEPCYEMIGNEASIDILSPAPTGSADNGTLTYDLFRSFGYDPTPVYLSE